MIGIALTEKLADTTESTSETASEIVQDAEQKAGLLRQYMTDLLDWCMSKVGSLVVAVIFMVIGFRVVKWIIKLIKRTFDRSNMDVSVAGFLLSAIRILMNFIILITAASIVGFQVTSFVTLLGTAGVTIGLALQGSLSNLAGGVLILILKPFHVGDYIIENNTKCEGEVVSIDIFYTKLKTIDNRSVVIPNGNISNTSLVNVTLHDKRRAEIKIVVGYEEDLDKVKRVVLDAVKTVPGYLADEAVDFFIDEFADSSIMICVRFYAKIDRYWDSVWAARWNIKKAFDENGIVIPYNKLDVNLDSCKKTDNRV